ncbi:hypothetical protein HDN1F_35920 [gamma proteobacterium HdN1]|nr:hypothetical protein HDN1F_35920 [gamma proteobacterium HdN1]
MNPIRFFAQYRNSARTPSRAFGARALQFVLMVCAVALVACEPQTDRARANQLVDYYLHIEQAPGAAPLTVEDIKAVLLLPKAAQPASTGPNGPKAAEPAHFSEIPLHIAALEAGEGGRYRLQLNEAPRVDGLLRIRQTIGAPTDASKTPANKTATPNLGAIELQALLLETGGPKYPIQINQTTTAATRMYLAQVLAQRGYGRVDVEQINTLISVVANHLATLDVPTKLSVPQQIDWYAERAEKSCTLRFSRMSGSVECATFTLGGEVRGLVGQLSLVVNQGDPLTITENGSFLFPAGLVNRTRYDVTVREQPAGQTCTVKYGSGRIHAQSVDGILVKCDDNYYPIGGLAEGIRGPVNLQLNGTKETLTIQRDGSFNFLTKLKHGEAYDVKISRNPPEVTCSLGRGVGYLLDTISDVALNCMPLLFQVGGEATGVRPGLILKVNDAEELPIQQDGPFMFATDFEAKASYRAVIQQQPPGQRCRLEKAQGVVGLDDVKTMQIRCTTFQYALGGNATGIRAPITLQLNDQETLNVRANGKFRFRTSLSHGSAYKVEISAVPEGMRCDFRNEESDAPAEGEITGNITQLNVHCQRLRYRISGSASGLKGLLVLALNGSKEQLSLSKNGKFTFETAVFTGERYQITVAKQPEGQLCEIKKGAGEIKAASVGGVRVSCEDLPPPEAPAPRQPAAPMPAASEQSNSVPLKRADQILRIPLVVVPG